MMLTTLPNLHTRRPSPTTVEYTVSTVPPLTVSLRLLLISSFLLRVLLGFSILLLLYSKWQLSIYSTPIESYDNRPPFFSNDYIWYIITNIHLSALGVLFSKFAVATPLLLLLPVSAIIGFATILRIHTEESLLVLRGLGIQTSTSSTTYLSTNSTRFIPTEKIQDVFVNEAFRGFEVRYYLVVTVEGEDEVVVVFPRLLPCRRIVETVWRGARECLYEPDETASKREKESGKG